MVSLSSVNSLSLSSSAVFLHIFAFISVIAAHTFCNSSRITCFILSSFVPSITVSKAGLFPFLFLPFLLSVSVFTVLSFVSSVTFDFNKSRILHRILSRYLSSPCIIKVLLDAHQVMENLFLSCSTHFNFSLFFSFLDPKYLMRVSLKIKTLMSAASTTAPALSGSTEPVAIIGLLTWLSWSWFGISIPSSFSVGMSSTGSGYVGPSPNSCSSSFSLSQTSKLVSSSELVAIIFLSSKIFRAE